MNRFADLTAGTLALAILLPSQHLHAKPIAYANGTTVMAEYGADSMSELQLFYAPRHFYSIGFGHLALQGDVGGLARDISYARLNYLVKRWNMEAAQANVFVWGSLGNMHVGATSQNELAWNSGTQVDYETRRIYSSLKGEWYESSGFTHRAATLQLGIAPYRHDYEDLATWFVVQAKRDSGDAHNDTEVALLLRLFKGGRWIEAGASTNGKLLAMIMVNF